MSVVLDAWGIIELLRGGAAGDRVRALVAQEAALMSSINLGEVQYALIRSYGDAVADARVEGVRRVVRVEDPDWSLVHSAARFKARGGMSFADAFRIATAWKHRAPLVTGDPEILAADTDVEVIDLRSRS